MATNDIQNIRISPDLWRKLHNHRNRHFYNKENDVFMRKYGLKPTSFNLSCLDLLKGIILTDRQNLLKGIILTDKQIIDKIKEGVIKK